MYAQSQLVFADVISYSPIFGSVVCHSLWQVSLARWHGVSRHPANKGGGESMVGFITARLTQLAESDPKDRALLGLSGAAADRQRAVYILTLGTVPALRQQVEALLAPVLETSVTHGSTMGHDTQSRPQAPYIRGKETTDSLSRRNLTSQSICASGCLFLGWPLVAA